MPSFLAHLRRADEARALERATVDGRLIALHRAGARDVRFTGSPQPGGHGHVALTFTLNGTPMVAEATTYAVALDRAETSIQRATRTP